MSSFRDDTIWLGATLDAKGSFSPLVKDSSYLRVAIKSPKWEIIRRVALIAEVDVDMIAATESDRPNGKDSYAIQFLGDEAVDIMQRALSVVCRETAVDLTRQLTEAGFPCPKTYGEYVLLKAQKGHDLDELLKDWDSSERDDWSS